MDIARLRQELETALTEKRLVITVVGVVGTTEEGAVDLVHELMGLREEFAQRRLSFSLYCDPAYGGYLAACFRTAAGEFRSHDEMQREYVGWPSEEMYKSYAALKHVDSFTVNQQSPRRSPRALRSIRKSSRTFPGKEPPGVCTRESAADDSGKIWAITRMSSAGATGTGTAIMAGDLQRSIPPRSRPSLACGATFTAPLTQTMHVSPAALMAVLDDKIMAPFR